MTGAVRYYGESFVAAVSKRRLQQARVGKNVAIQPSRACPQSFALAAPCGRGLVFDQQADRAKERYPLVVGEGNHDLIAFLVDIEVFPDEHPKYGRFQQILNKLALEVREQSLTVQQLQRLPP